MKQLLITTILLLAYSINNICIGQTEFAPIGSKWLYEKVFFSPTGEEESKSFITISSTLDTLINDYSCRQIIVKEILMDEGLEFKDSSFICQSNDSVFQIKNEEFRLLFNFSLEKDDTLFVDSTKSLFYTIDTTYLSTIESKTLKTQSVSIFCGDSAFPTNEVTFIEQIGPVESSLYPEIQTISYLLFPDYECLQDVVPTIKFICYTENSWSYNPDNDPLCEFLTSNNNVKRSEKSIFFKVYPNPAKEVIFIENKFNNSLSAYELYNINGSVIHQGKSTSKNFSINLSQVTSPGVYVLSIKNEAMTETHILIIE